MVCDRYFNTRRFLFPLPLSAHAAGSCISLSLPGYSNTPPLAPVSTSAWHVVMSDEEGSVDSLRLEFRATKTPKNGDLQKELVVVGSSGSGWWWVELGGGDCRAAVERRRR